MSGELSIFRVINWPNCQACWLNSFGRFFGFFLWVLPLDSSGILLAILLGFSFWSFFALLDTLLGFPLLFALPLDSLYAIPTVKLIRNQKFSASCRDLLCLTFNYLPSQFGGIRRLIKFKPPIAKIRGQRREREREGDVWSEDFGSFEIATLCMGRLVGKEKYIPVNGRST